MDPTRSVRGFALLELVLVLAVLGILLGAYVGTRGSSSAQGPAAYKPSVDRSQEAACVAGRSALRTNLQMFQMSNPTVPLTAENLQKHGVTLPACPAGGAVSVAADGTVLCSLHNDKAR